MFLLLVFVSEAEFKEFEPRLKFKQRLKFKSRLKYGWFHLKLYLIFQYLRPALNCNRFLADLSRGSNSLISDTGFQSFL